MEFYTTTTIDASAAELQRRLTISELPRWCASIEKVLSDEVSSGEIFCVWGTFVTRREELNGGVRFSLPGCPNVMQWTDTGRAVVKLSGAFRESHRPFPFDDMNPFVEAVLKAFTPQNCVWGSDWPFLNIDPKPDYAKTLACLERWLPDKDQRRQVLSDTPERLFGFRQYPLDKKA